MSRNGYEKFMSERLEGLRRIINDNVIKNSIMSVAIRKIYKSKTGSRITASSLLNFIQVITFCVDTSKGETNAKFLDGHGPETSAFRSAVVLDCIHRMKKRDVPTLKNLDDVNGDSDLPFWMKESPTEVEGVVQHYLVDDMILDGLKRCERIPVKDRKKDRFDDGMKRRNAIACNETRPIAKDDCDYIGWWIYVELTGILHLSRKQGPILAFEYLFYLFEPWSDSDLPHSVSKSKLKMKWISGRCQSNYDLNEIPFSNCEIDDEENDERNKQIYNQFVADHV